jgi:DNA transposition AAA+ family ATPase
MVNAMEHSEKDEPVNHCQWVEKEVARLQQPTIVLLPHLQELHQWLDGKREARRSCRIIGQSRTGKTFACESYAALVLKRKAANRRHIPVVNILPPPNCKSRVFFELILEAMKYQAIKGTIGNVRNRVTEVLKYCEVEMLIIDEADRLQPDTFKEARDINQKLGIAVVIVGTEELNRVIKKDDQIYNRFRSHRKFEQLTGSEFERIVKVWEGKVINLPIPSNLSQPKALKLLFESTDGYIGRLDELLRESAVASILRGHKKIEFSILQEVAQELSL